MRGTGDYPENWGEIARAAKEAAGWRCVRCGHPHTNPCDEQCFHLPDGKQRVLTVHHLDGNKGNCRWWNIPPLCQVCHLQIQAKVIMGQSYLYPHTRWFRLYAAGFYAFAITGEDLTREDVECRLEELLALGQPHLSPTEAEASDE